MDMAGVFAVPVILSAMGVGLHLLAQSPQRRILFWMDEPPEHTAGA
jgi:NitT/TauT family transport system permease protein